MKSALEVSAADKMQNSLRNSTPKRKKYQAKVTMGKMEEEHQKDQLSLFHRLYQKPVSVRESKRLGLYPNQKMRRGGSLGHPMQIPLGLIGLFQNRLRDLDKGRKIRDTSAMQSEKGRVNVC